MERYACAPGVRRSVPYLGGGRSILLSYMGIMGSAGMLTQHRQRISINNCIIVLKKRKIVNIVS